MIDIDINSTSDWIGITGIIITVVSTITTVRQTKKARQYKKQVLLFRSIFDLEALHSHFQIESNRFLEKTSDAQWYRGTNPGSLISRYIPVLQGFGKIYPLIKNPEALRSKVHSLHAIIQSSGSMKGNRTKNQEAPELILCITEILEQEINRNREKVILH